MCGEHLDIRTYILTNLVRLFTQCTLSSSTCARCSIVSRASYNTQTHTTLCSKIRTISRCSVRALSAGWRSIRRRSGKGVTLRGGGGVAFDKTREHSTLYHIRAGRLPRQLHRHVALLLTRSMFEFRTFEKQKHRVAPGLLVTVWQTRRLSAHCALRKAHQSPANLPQNVHTCLRHRRAQRAAQIEQALYEQGGCNAVCVCVV
jgi:hypothetical protein